MFVISFGNFLVYCNMFCGHLFFSSEQRQGQIFNNGFFVYMWELWRQSWENWLKTYSGSPKQDAFGKVSPKALLWLKTRKPLLFDIAAKSSKLSNQSSHNRAISPWGIRSEQARHIPANFRDRLGKPPEKLFNCMTSLPWKTAKGKYVS